MTALTANERQFLRDHFDPVRTAEAFLGDPEVRLLALAYARQHPNAQP